MSRTRFDLLLSHVGLYFSRQRAEITPAERLAVTLPYFATGNSQVSLSFNFRIGKSTVCGIMRDTSQAIWEGLQPHYVRSRSSQKEWKAISDQFEAFGTSQIALVLSMGNMWLFRHPPTQDLLSLITKEATRSS